MIPVRLKIWNYGPFRGVHEVFLNPLVYSVVARDETDVERSNWIGKSYFLSAFRFALYGKRSPSARTEDEWISSGEQEGGVELELEGSVLVSRKRRRGRSTQLEVTRGGSAASQDRAQEIIDKLVGFTAKDFDASCWVKQKGSNAIVVADPADRTRTVGGWMDMTPLQRAEQAESKRLLVAIEADTRLASREGQLRELIDSVGDPAELAVQIERLEGEAAEHENALDGLTDRIEVAWKAAELDKRSAEFDQLVADGQALKARIQAEQGGEDLSATLAEIEAAQARIESDFGEAKREAERVGRLVVGEGFDGHCPVMRAECPAAEQVRETARKLSGEYQRARDALTAIQGERGRVAGQKAQLSEQVRARAANVGRLQAMRERAIALQAEIDQLSGEVGEDREDVEELRAEAARLQARVGIVRGDAAALGRQLGSVDGWTSELAKVEAERDELAKRIRTHREAVIVLGRNGAQRRVAEGNLTEIEAGANDLLGGAGIDLSVKARWGREGSGLAKHCSACGQPFPASAKVKECQTCGAQRGPHIVEKLELEPVPNSDGAAEDVAGLAMQLSAAAWLRARRSASWAAAFIDEPFAAADARVGSLLASRLRVLLGGRYSFRQAFVISHNSALTESMSGRIEIVKRRDGTLGVIAA